MHRSSVRCRSHGVKHVDAGRHFSLPADGQVVSPFRKRIDVRSAIGRTRLPALASAAAFRGPLSCRTGFPAFFPSRFRASVQIAADGTGEFARKKPQYVQNTVNMICVDYLSWTVHARTRLFPDNAAHRHQTLTGIGGKRVSARTIIAW